MTQGSTSPRTPSLLDASCESYILDLAELSPTQATAWGIAGYDGELQDYSPEYFDAVAERTREMIADVDALNDGTDCCDDDDDFDDVDVVTAKVLRDRLCLELSMHHHGEDIRELNNLASPVQDIRDTFLLMPQDTDEDLDAIASRLSKVPAALTGYRESLRLAASLGKVAAERQVDAVVKQCRELAEPGSMLEKLGLDAGHAAVTQAKQAFGEMSEWLGDNLAAQAPRTDGVGRERYQRFSHHFVGFLSEVDQKYGGTDAGLRRTPHHTPHPSRRF